MNKYLIITLQIAVCINMIATFKVQVDHLYHCLSKDYLFPNKKNFYVDILLVTGILISAILNLCGAIYWVFFK